MLKNPYINALLAALYIVLIVLVLSRIVDVPGEEETLLVPMTMLSLLVLSVTVMGLLFVYTPAKMFLDNQKNEALAFFVKEIATFASVAVVFVLLLILL